MIAKILTALLIAGCYCQNLLAAELPLIQERTFQERMLSLRADRPAADKLIQAKMLASKHRLSSLQIKAIAASLSDDASRLDFATHAYPSTIDPENFYEVYDAFTSFSKVMRLHDRIREWRHNTVPLNPVPISVSDEDMKDIIQAIRNESMDKARQNLARQIIGAKACFTSKQIAQIVKLFDFESGKLEIAKFAYDYAIDPQNYYLVNACFDFDHTKESLSRHIDSKRNSVSKGN